MASFHGVPKPAWRVSATLMALDNMVNQALQICSALVFDNQYLHETGGVEDWKCYNQSRNPIIYSGSI